MSKTIEIPNIAPQPTSKQLRRQARRAGFASGAARAVATGATTEAVLLAGEQHPVVTGAVGLVAVAGAGISLAKGIRRNRLEKQVPIAKAQEAQQRQVQQRVAQLSEKLGIPQPEQQQQKGGGALRRAGRWAIAPFLDSTKQAARNVAVPSPRAPEQGAPVARSRVEALDMQAQHNVAMGRLANMVAAEAPGAASQPPHPEERPPVAPAPQGQEPFPLKAIIQR